MTKVGTREGKENGKSKAEEKIRVKRDGQDLQRVKCIEYINKNDVCALIYLGFRKYGGENTSQIIWKRKFFSN